MLIAEIGVGTELVIAEDNPIGVVGVIRNVAKDHEPEGGTTTVVAAVVMPAVIGTSYNAQGKAWSRPSVG